MSSEDIFFWSEQIAEIGKRHPGLGLGLLRFVLTRSGESDVMTLKAESNKLSEAPRKTLVSTPESITKLPRRVAPLAMKDLTKYGKAIADEPN